MSQNRSKSLGTLGLAMKSGNVVSGEFLTEQAIRAGTARLVIVAEDASDNTKKKFCNSCSYYQVPLAILKRNILSSDKWARSSPSYYSMEVVSWHLKVH